MFKDPEELKAFIVWAREQKIQRIKVDKIEIELSTFAFLDESLLTPTKPVIVKTDTPVPEKAAEETEDPDLFWSTSN